MINPAYIKLFKFKPGIRASALLSQYNAGTIQPDITYEIIHNYIPNRIRKANLYDISGTETRVPDINELSDTVYQEVTSDELVSKILWTNYESTLDRKHQAYMRFLNGHCELAFLVDGSILSNTRFVLLVVTDSDGRTIVSTADDNDPQFDNNVTSSYMECSSNKIVRILLQRNKDEDGFYIKPYSGYFESVDLGILELSTNFDTRYTAKWGSNELFKFIDNYRFGVQKVDNDYLISYYNNVIGSLTANIDVI